MTYAVQRSCSFMPESSQTKPETAPPRNTTCTQSALPVEDDEYWRRIIGGVVLALQSRASHNVNNDAFAWPDEHDRLCPCDLKTYLERVHRYSFASPAAFVMSLVYVDRLVRMSVSRKHRTRFEVTRQNVHLLGLVAIATASKFLDDKFVSNKRYARSEG